MSNDDDAAIEALLSHELNHFANSLEWTSEISALSPVVAVRIANAVERISRRASTDRERRRCVTLCALLWEHRQADWLGLRPVLFLALARLGLGPSANMLESSPDSAGSVHASLGSLRLESAVTAHLLEHEVRSRHAEAPLLLTGFQRRVWQALNRSPRLGISAPTSAGKSFVLANHLVDRLQPGDQCIYVVPTVSLIHQVTSDLRKLAWEQRLSYVNVEQSVTPLTDGSTAIYVLTQERALAALSRPEMLGSLNIAIFDEIQNIEHVAKESDDRSQTLREVIRIISTELSPPSMVIAGARISNIDALTTALLGERSETVADDIPTVSSITYSIGHEKKQLTLTQHSDLLPTRRKAQISIGLTGFRPGGQQYTAPTLALLGHISARLRETGTIIFSPTSKQTTLTATALANEERRPWPRSESLLRSLADYLKATVHEQYPLANCVARGIGYHHGKMPFHARACVEAAFAERHLDTVICTTTLMQGVNLPAKTLVIRNPDLFIKKSADQTNPRITSYEFSNLRGRAGRLMHDFVGRALVIDEASFAANGIELTTDATRDVTTSYADRFQGSREDIVDSLQNGVVVDYIGSAPDLVLFIRRMILRHDDAAERLRSLGIDLAAGEVAAVARQLSELTIPRDICLALPFWDPLVLDRLYPIQFDRLPASPFDQDFKDRLSGILNLLQEHAPFYFNKHLGFMTRNQELEILISAQNWCCERSLKEIVTRRKELSVDASTIDHRVSVITNQVSYDLPQLLRPVCLFQNPENPLLGMMEMGAYRPETRQMIEMGIPREVACQLVRLGVRANDSERGMVEQIQRLLVRCHPWEQRQITRALPELAD